MESEFSDPVCESHKPNKFGPVVIRAFAQLGAGAASALPQPTLHVEECFLRKKAQRNLAKSLSAALAAVGSAIEADDQSSARHQGRVATIACAIAGEMGWDEDHIHAVQVASTLHDVGKIIVSEEILTKPGRLTEEEFAQVELHPEAGYAILRDIPFPWPIAETVRQHHERMDGSGYPRGLKGDEILPMARLLAIADMLDAMTSARSYRPALELEVVLVELEGQAGTRLDTEMVRRCASLFREKRCELPR
jgi:HD-GYP domain-containing protein (c-di-GMP phosphodiesterase class II)